MIRIENLVKRFGTFEAVKGISLQVNKGELFCFLGPNGAGKTTTIKMLCGLLHRTEGTITIGGHDLHRNGTDVREITGYIPDTPFLYDLLTVTEFMRFTGDLYSIPPDQLREETEESLVFFGLQDHRTSLIKDLLMDFGSGWSTHPRSCNIRKLSSLTSRSSAWTRTASVLSRSCCERRRIRA
jgi:ABC-2 type transport system ATP-binding protein